MEVLEKETNVAQSPVSFTQDAIDEINHLLEKENKSGDVAYSEIMSVLVTPQDGSN